MNTKNHSFGSKANKPLQTERILARRVAQELSPSEVETVAGGRMGVCCCCIGGRYQADDCC